MQVENSNLSSFHDYVYRLEYLRNLHINTPLIFITFLETTIITHFGCTLHYTMTLILCTHIMFMIMITIILLCMQLKYNRKILCPLRTKCVLFHEHFDRPHNLNRLRMRDINNNIKHVYCYVRTKTMLCCDN